MKNKFSGQISIVISTILCGILGLLFSLNHNQIPFSNIIIIIISLCCACIVSFVFAIRKIHLDRNDDTTDQLLDLVYFLENYEVTEKNKEIYDLYVNKMAKGKTAPFKLRNKLNGLLKKRGYAGYSYELSLSDTIRSYYEVIGFSVISFGWCSAVACAIRLLITLQPLSVLFWIGLILVVAGYIYYEIFNDSKRTNKASIFAGLIACIVIVGACFASGTIRANHVNSTCKDIHISIVEKCASDEKSMYVDGYVMKIKCGDTFWADLSPVIGTEQGGIRPVVVVQNDQLNDESVLNGGTIIVAPLTSTNIEVGLQTKNTIMSVAVPELDLCLSQILPFAIRAIDVSRLGEYVGRLDDSTVNELDNKIALTLGLCTHKTALEGADFRKSNSEKKSEVTKILRQLGIPADIPGYLYLRTAILLVVEDFDLIKDVSELYSNVAIQHSATLEQVETEIYKAIEFMSDRADIDAYMYYFSYTYDSNLGRPTNSECIATIADSIRLNKKA